MISERVGPWLIAPALATLAALAGCAHGRPAESAPPWPTPNGDATAPGAPGGHLVLIGGGRKPKAAVDLFVRLAGGPEARIVVLPLASEDSRAAGDDYVALFGERGAREVRVLHIDDRRDALRRSFVEAIDAATGVFFGGGDQSRIAARIVGTPVHDALARLKARGGVLGGTSAGTACQSAVMLTGMSGNERALAWANIPTSRGLGFFEGVVVDSHFVVRRRHKRLTNVVLEYPDLLGVGVDEATAAWVRPDGTMQVVGESVVLVYDAKGAVATRRSDGTLDVSGVTERTLSPGQVFDLKAREPRL